MKTRFTTTVALVCAGAGLLAGCSGGTVAGTPTPASGSASASTGAASSSAGSDAPTVQNPLPESVLDGSPCDSALTTEQVTDFIGTPDAPGRDDGFETGPACNWHSADGVSGGIAVYYATKTGGGLNLVYQNTKPKSARFEASEIQGYPAVAYTGKNDDPSVTGICLVSVGIRDDLTFGVGLTLGDSARKRGVDSCEGAKDVANTVLTSLKGRA